MTAPSTQISRKSPTTLPRPQPRDATGRDVEDLARVGQLGQHRYGDEEEQTGPTRAQHVDRVLPRQQAGDDRQKAGSPATTHMDR